MTVEEFYQVKDWEEGWRYELIHEVLMVNLPAGPGERRPNEELGHWLLTYKVTHPQGGALDDTVNEQDIVTTGGVRRADRVIWANLGRLPDYHVELGRLFQIADRFGDTPA